MNNNTLLILLAICIDSVSASEPSMDISFWTLHAITNLAWTAGPLVPDLKEAAIALATNNDGYSQLFYQLWGAFSSGAIDISQMLEIYDTALNSLEEGTHLIMDLKP